MKRALTTAGLTAAAFLTTALPVFAQTTIKTCPKGSFASLCNLKAEQFGSLVQTGVTMLLVIITVVSLFFLIWGGMRWVTSGGDKAKVEEARKTIVSAIVGLVIAFLAYFILNVVLSVFGLSLDNLKLPTLVGN